MWLHVALAQASFNCNQIVGQLLMQVRCGHAIFNTIYLPATVSIVIRSSPAILLVLDGYDGSYSVLLASFPVLLTTSFSVL